MPEITHKPRNREPAFVLTKVGNDVKKTYVIAQTFGCSCPHGHKTFVYKTRVPAEDIQVYCPHCGVRCFVTMRSL